MKTLLKPNEQLAGNIEMFLTPIVNIQSLSGGTLTVTDEEMILKVVCMRETISHQVSAVKTKAGRKFVHKITATAYGQSADNDDLLDLMMTYKLYAILRESSGKYVGVGNEHTGLGMEWEHDSGSDGSGFKGYLLSLTGEVLIHKHPLTSVLDLNGLPVNEVIASTGLGD